MRETITWQDVLDCKKLPGMPMFDRCQEIAKNVGYKYISFNDMVYSVDVKRMTKICDSEQLAKGVILIPISPT